MFLSNYGKIHKVYKSFLIIRNITIFKIIKYTNKNQINDNNKILLLYIIDTFYLYYK